MADAKITQLMALTDPVPTDLLAIVDDPAGTPVTKKVALSNIFSLVYPIGCVYTSVVETNPSDLFGFGTWLTFGTGQVLVGFDATQTEFDTVEETGGAKTVTLDTTMIPAHTHVSGTHTHLQTAHNHIERMNTATTGATGAGFPAVADASTSGGPGNLWVTTADTTAVNQATAVTLANTGGGLAHNNLQPYITVYMWKRTA